MFIGGFEKLLDKRTFRTIYSMVCLTNLEVTVFNLSELKNIEQAMIDSYVEGKFENNLQQAEDIIYTIHMMIQNLEIQLRIEQYDAMNPIEAAKVIV